LVKKCGEAGVGFGKLPSLDGPYDVERRRTDHVSLSSTKTDFTRHTVAKVVGVPVRRLGSTNYSENRELNGSSPQLSRKRRAEHDRKAFNAIVSFSRRDRE
jgi:hypothetical protein